MHIHAEQFAGTDVGDLTVSSFEDEVVVYGLAFRVPGQGLVLDNYLYGETPRVHYKKNSILGCLKPFLDTIIQIGAQTP